MARAVEKSEIAPAPPNVHAPGAGATSPQDAPAGDGGTHAPSPQGSPTTSPQRGAEPLSPPGTGLQPAARPEDTSKLLDAAVHAPNPAGAQARAVVPADVVDPMRPHLRAGEPIGPREIPIQPGDPEPIRPKRTMPGVAFVNDTVPVGSTPMVPDHLNPLATEEQKRASTIRAAEEADVADRRRMHAERRPEMEQRLREDPQMLSRGRR